MLKKRIFSLVLALIGVIAMSLCLGACGDEESEPKNVDYSITVTDPAGKPCSDVIVTIFEGPASKGMKPTDKNGVAVFNLLEGDYTFVLTAVDGEFFYDSAACVLSKDKTTASVVVADISAKTIELYNGSVATVITAGSYGIELDSEKITYLLFTAELAGRYKVSVSAPDASVGNYGAPLLIYDNDISNENDRENGAIYIDVRTYNVSSADREATPYLLGITSASDVKAIVTVERVSDLALSPEEQPWQEYSAPAIDSWTFAGGATVDIDITSPTVSVVYNEADGFYHYGNEDGPLVLVKLTAPSKYVSASIEDICASQYFGVYYFDENRNYSHKISYQTAILYYISVAAKEENSGYCPLTEELRVIFTEMGKYLNWYAVSDAEYVNPFFGTLNFVPENAWLFACCYVQ